MQTAVIHAASRPPQLSHFAFGGDGGVRMHGGLVPWCGNVLGRLSQFTALRHCKLDGVSLCGEYHGENIPTHVDPLAGTLRSMPHLESLRLYVFVTNVRTGLLPVLDALEALEAAGTSHCCTALCVEHEHEFIHEDLS